MQTIRRAGPGGAEPAAKACASAEAGEEKSSWRDFEKDDPLYALLGQVLEDRVTDDDGQVREATLERYLEVLIVQKAVRKPKDWVEVWAKMQIPIESQAAVLTPILRFAIQHAPQGFGKELGELLKGHRTKTSAMQEAVRAAYGGSADPPGTLRECLFLVFPKSPTSEWGWARVGWGWQQWWQLAEGLLSSLDGASAFDELSRLLDALEAKSGIALAKQQIWDEKRLGLARSLLCKLGHIQDEADLLACLDATLVPCGAGA